MKHIRTFVPKEPGNYRGTYFGISDKLCDKLVKRRWGGRNQTYLDPTLIHDTLRMEYKNERS